MNADPTISDPTNSDPSWQIYLINLERSPDRLKIQKEQFEKLGLDYIRVSAVDGKQIEEKLDGLDKRAYDFRHGKKINPNELGCYLSHYRAIEEFMKSDNQYAVILEDDARFDEDPVPMFKALFQHSDLWDVVNLSGRRKGMPVTQKQLTSEYSLVAYMFRQTGAAAYMINRHAGQQYLNKLLPMKVPYDHEYDRAWVYGIKCRGVEPNFVNGKSIPTSTIGYDYELPKSTTKKPQWKRGSVLLYRGWNELSRITHYVVRGLFIPRS